MSFEEFKIFSEIGVYFARLILQDVKLSETSLG